MPILPDRDGLQRGLDGVVFSNIVARVLVTSLTRNGLDRILQDVGENHWWVVQSRCVLFFEPEKQTVLTWSRISE